MLDTMNILDSLIINLLVLYLISTNLSFDICFRLDHIFNFIILTKMCQNPEDLEALVSSERV